MIIRHAAAGLAEALEDRPVVLVLGPRQCGKSTLCESVAKAGRGYVTLDDPIALALAERDPAAFLQTYSPPLTLDEIQRAPRLFLPIKQRVDRKKEPGSYLLTGSANVLSLPKMADSLAGRMEIVDLLPFSQGELEGAPNGFAEAAFGEDFEPKFVAQSAADLAQRIARGGFPEPALQSRESRRSAWFAAYVRSMLERDVRDVADIEGLRQMPLLLELLAARSGSVLNASGIAADSGIPYTSLRRYIGLLQAIYLVTTVGSWSSGGSGNLVAKTPKMYFLDTGLMCHLANLDPAGITRDRLRFAALLENFAASELLKQTRVGTLRPRLLHLRTVRHLEVDFVLEARGGDVVGVDVKPSETLNPDDAKGLMYLQELAGDKFRRGIVLYLGTEQVPLAPNITALPISSLWMTGK